MSSAPLKIAVLGAGTVGSQVVRLLQEQGADLSARVGAELKIIGVSVKDPARSRHGINPNLLTTDSKSLVKNCDILIEVMGGIEPAKSLILEAMQNGASVVTANKALLARHGSELLVAADKAGVDLYFEASVAGAIPLLRPIRESLAGDTVNRVMGIVNGTTNFILSKMETDGADYQDVLAEAQSLGYAESDPTADVEGHDAAAKAAILATLAFHTPVTIDDVYCEGITKVTKADMDAAESMGFVIKLLAVAERQAQDSIVVRVHPTMVPKSHPLANVRGVFNAVFVEAESAGELMFFGRGAGGAPTASAVLGDVVAAARNRVAGGVGPRDTSYAALKCLDISNAHTRYYIHIKVADKPGVLAKIATTFAENKVSIQVLHQDGHGDDATLVIRTHKATDAALAKTLDGLKKLDVVDSVIGVMRVEGEQGE
ncbi:MAG: homoserine dehydrogenase [actinobacterium acAMD-5]|nr:MAG: homoserine dehydrogenase [actinobacterium acAMD-5]